MKLKCVKPALGILTSDKVYESFGVVVLPGAMNQIMLCAVVFADNKGWAWAALENFIPYVEDEWTDEDKEKGHANFDDFMKSVNEKKI